MRTRTLPLATATLGAAGLGYAWLEARWFTLRRARVAVLPRGAEEIRVLHLSDLHLAPYQHRKRAWLRTLAATAPDLVVSTGDNLGHLDALPGVVEAYGDLLDVPGVFVLGSNDYFSPVPKNPGLYLTGGTGSQTRGARERRPDLPYDELRAAFTARGWTDLSNRHGELTVRGQRIAFVGVDDPHLEYDRLDDEPADPGADLTVGVAHAPYLRILDRWTTQGYRMIFAGHTHGGQLCLPGFGALVTNCDLDRTRASGLHRHRVDGHDPSWVHVSAGVGTSPFAPVRFACRPEATLLTLTPLDSPELPA